MIIQSLEHLINLDPIFICHQLLGEAGLLLLTCKIGEKSVYILCGVVVKVRTLK